MVGFETRHRLTAGHGGHGILAGLALLMMVVAILALTQCSQVLELKTLVRNEVALSKVGLTLYDGSTPVFPGDTVAWDATIFGDPLIKTLKLKNNGDSNVALSGPNVVVNNGGSASFVVSGQPGLATLAPGDETSFTVTWTPPAADTDYVCDLVVNSSDSTYPTYHFTGSGHSTQWHGSLAAATGAGVFLSPQVYVDAGTVFLSYAPPSGDIPIRSSTNGGKTFSLFANSGVGSPYPHFLGSTSGQPHVFSYKNTATYGVSYAKWLTATTSMHTGIQSSNATAGDSTRPFHGSLLLSTYVFLAWYDTATSSLMYNFSIDPFWQSAGSTVIDSFMGSDAQLTGGATGNLGGEVPSMKRDSSNNLYLLYADNASATRRLRVFKVGNSDLDFNPLPAPYAGPASASNQVIYQSALVLTESGSTVTAHAFWTQDYPLLNVYHSSSTDLVTWSTPAQIGTSENNRYGKSLPVAVDGSGAIHVLHENSVGSVGIRLSTSRDGGSTWTHQTLDGHASFGSTTWFPSAMALCASGTALYAAYTTYSSHPNGYSVTLKKSIDGGLSW